MVENYMVEIYMVENYMVEKTQPQIPPKFAHLHSTSIMIITTKFHEILLNGFGGVVLKRKTGLT